MNQTYIFLHHSDGTHCLMQASFLCIKRFKVTIFITGLCINGLIVNVGLTQGESKMNPPQIEKKSVDKLVIFYFIWVDSR